MYMKDTAEGKKWVTVDGIIAAKENSIWMTKKSLKLKILCIRKYYRCNYYNMYYKRTVVLNEYS